MTNCFLIQEARVGRLVENLVQGSEEDLSAGFESLEVA